MGVKTMISKSTGIKGCAAFLALLALLLCGDIAVFAQEKSSVLYSTYDARELIKKKSTKG